MEEFSCPIELEQLIANLDPIKTAAKIAGLCVCPEMQSNQGRLEWVLPIILKYAKSTNEVSADLLNKIFIIAGQNVGYKEDPAEDVFTSNVHNYKNNFVLFEGLWESNAFYTQRFLDILEIIPHGQPFANLKNVVFDMLTLSNTIAKRKGLTRYMTGNEYPVEALPDSIMSHIDYIHSPIVFSSSDLQDIGIEKHSIENFSCCFQNFLDENINGESLLREKPIVKHNNCYYVMFASAIGIALRRYIIEEIESLGLIDLLEKKMAEVYSVYFHNTVFAAQWRNFPVKFKYYKESQTYIAVNSISITDNKIIIFIVFQDNFVSKEIEWFEGFNGSSDKLCEKIVEIIYAIKEEQKEKKHEILIQLVSCGWGRGIMLSMPDDIPENITIDHVSAPDLATLSKTRDFSLLTLWRIREAQKLIQAQNVEILNCNGMLNLYSFMSELDGHIIPHENLLDFEDDCSFMLSIPTNNLLTIRQKVLTSYDEHIIIDDEGDFLPIIKKNYNSFFPNDQDMLYCFRLKF